jgi:peptide chain release factor 1
MESGGDFEVVQIEQRPGYAVLKISGPGAASLAETEPGGHRWQERSGKKGRVHTSTVTVAVLSEEQSARVEIDQRDLEFTFYRATGAGGQHRNKTDSACRVVHLPTGTSARSENSRSQHQNKAKVLEALQEKLQEIVSGAARTVRRETRKGQVGSGQRGDKRRTIRTQDGSVTDHVLGRQGKVKAYLKGNLDWLTE